MRQAKRQEALSLQGGEASGIAALSLTGHVALNAGSEVF